MSYRIIFLATLLMILTGCKTIQGNKVRVPYCHKEDVSSRLSWCTWEYLKGTDKKKTFEEQFERSHKEILIYYQGPLKDGNKYSGEIAFCSDRDGVIDNIILTKPSGHKGMDEALMDAIRKAKKISVPNDECLADRFYFSRVRLNYSESYLADK